MARNTVILFKKRHKTHINAETSVEKIAKLIRQTFSFLNVRFSILSYQINSFQRRFVEIWRFTVQHLQRHDTQRPDVNLEEEKIGFFFGILQSTSVNSPTRLIVTITLNSHTLFCGKRGFISYM